MNSVNTSWLLLIASLPTSGATPRMRLWRALKALGCAALRDGAYLLPEREGHTAALTELAEQTNQDGGQAWVVNLEARSAADEQLFIGLFDRSADYAALVTRLRQGSQSLPQQGPAEIGKNLKRLRKELAAIQALDFFPSEAALNATAAWAAFEEAARAMLAPDEPQPTQRDIVVLDKAHYQGRTWATRRNLWADRVASAWLILRFIDSKAKVLWLDHPADCPRDALGFDFDGANFTHVGERVTFEVLLASFGLQHDPALQKLAEIVHVLDVGGANVPQAAGLEAILSGASTRLQNDDALLLEIGTVLDSLYIHFKNI